MNPIKLIMTQNTLGNFNYTRFSQKWEVTSFYDLKLKVTTSEF